MNTDIERLRQILQGESFESFGIDRLCYVKRTEQSGSGRYAVHGADGTYLWRYADRATADAALRQHEMEPLSVH
ncbi:MAG TPA: DUF1150 family protein [Acetobacteraceae bacterium]|jgi:hypothetical protein|nr:DUF1150 family protein [Acetobacteraceae bacterium]